MAIDQQRRTTDTSFIGTNRNALRDLTASVLAERGISAPGRIEEITDVVTSRMAARAPLLDGLVPVDDPASALSHVRNIIDQHLQSPKKGQTNGKSAPAATKPATTWDPSKEPQPRLSPNAAKVLETRYLQKDKSGKPVETARDLYARVASAIAQGERHFNASDEEVGRWSHVFYNLMASLKWQPNSPTLVNAGNGGKGSLSACFTISPQDTMDSIMQVAYDAAMVEKWGGGIGFGFSALRPKGDRIATTHGMACGPVAVMKLYSKVGETLTQGAFRLGAHMGQLNISHPDIREFIHAKDDDVSLQNFNISVQITDAFMEAVEKDADWNLVNPHDGKAAGTVKAKALWQEICESAWKTGGPGVVFMDRVWETQPNPQLGWIQTSNPCGEEFLEDYGNCCLGSIDLGKHIAAGEKDFDWKALEETVRTGVRFLDDVIEVNTFPVPKLRETNLKTRRIGLGVMGWADALIEMGIPYDSEEGVRLATRVSAFIKNTAWDESAKLAKVRGPFPEYESSALKARGMPPVRHSSVVTIAPTGTISRLADCSSGIEPHFALAWHSNILWEDHKGKSTRFLDAPGPVRKALVAEVGEEKAREFLERLAENPSAKNDPDIAPILAKKAVRTTNDIGGEWHVRMQAAWQENVTNSVSKTINLPNSATVQDVSDAYMLAFKLTCKAVTVYRDGSKSMQVLETGATAKARKGESAEEPTVETPSSTLPAEIPAPLPRYLAPRERPNVVSGVTERVRTGHGNMYITINSDEVGNPFEVFSTAGKGGGCDAAYMEAISRLASLALRSGVDPSQVIDQLRGITCDPFYDQGTLVRSPADAIALALTRQLEREQQEEAPFAIQYGLKDTSAPQVERGQAVPMATMAKPVGSFQSSCPECHSAVVYEEGCMKCYSCGYSKC